MKAATTTDLYQNVLKTNNETEKTINRYTAMHKCITCGIWFESTQLTTNKCDNCK